ncbi:AAA family ATPase [Bradyrhizobium sp. HKCCYLS2033]|uniref:AAA family ATPase n=1 Tax=Bradyrhizobium sp. HKCCYLS2033 TaxID=3420739 RepID=UPI003EB93976
MLDRSSLENAAAAFDRLGVRDREEPPPPSGPEDYGLSSSAPAEWQWRLDNGSWTACDAPSDADMRQYPGRFRPLYAATPGAPAQQRGPAAPFATITPAAWRGTEPQPQRWLAQGRVPRGDLTILAGNGGSGKTEIAVQLLVSAAAGLGDWLGCVVDPGAALFLSCEEPEDNVRDRVERIAKHRQIDPHAIADLHLVFPELDQTWLCSVDRAGKVHRTPLLELLEAWIAQHKPAVVVIDSVAAVFDGDAIQRRQVRAFLAMLRKLARDRDVAILLLDHPSVRGMSDGSGTANSVDWRNSVRSMLHLSDPEQDDSDARTLEVKKSNRGRVGDKTRLRWTGLTFTTEQQATTSPERAAAERKVEETFLRLLDRFTAEGREVRHTTGNGYAPGEFAAHPEARGIKAKALAEAMQRLFASGQIKVVQGKRSKHLERAPQA